MHLTAVPDTIRCNKNGYLKNETVVKKVKAAYKCRVFPDYTTQIKLEQGFNGRLHLPCSMVVSGPSNCRKTLSKILLKRLPGLFHTVLITLRTPQADDTLLPTDKNNLLIIDDLVNDAANNIEGLTLTLTNNR